MFPRQLTLILATLIAWGCDLEPKERIVPTTAAWEGHTSIADIYGVISNDEMVLDLPGQKQTFDQIIDALEEIYGFQTQDLQMFPGEEGRTIQLTFCRYWNSGRDEFEQPDCPEDKDPNWVNASAGAPRHGHWVIELYRGLATREELGLQGVGFRPGDGFALVACHEVGHLFGGFPFCGLAHFWPVRRRQCRLFCKPCLPQAALGA